MQVRISGEEGLREFLKGLKPGQTIRIVFWPTQPGVALRAAGMVTAGLLKAPPMVIVTLLAVSWRGDWEPDGQTFEFELADEFRQPAASRIVAEAIWFGMRSIEVVET